MEQTRCETKKVLRLRLTRHLASLIWFSSSSFSTSVAIKIAQTNKIQFSCLCACTWMAKAATAIKRHAESGGQQNGEPQLGPIYIFSRLFIQQRGRLTDCFLYAIAVRGNMTTWAESLSAQRQRARDRAVIRRRWRTRKKWVSHFPKRNRKHRTGEKGRERERDDAYKKMSRGYVLKYLATEFLYLNLLRKWIQCE